MITKTRTWIAAAIVAVAAVAGLVLGLAFATDAEAEPQPNDTASCHYWATEHDDYRASDANWLCGEMWKSGWDIDDMKFRHYQEASTEAIELWERIFGGIEDAQERGEF